MCDGRPGEQIVNKSLHYCIIKLYNKYNQTNRKQIGTKKIVKKRTCFSMFTDICKYIQTYTNIYIYKNIYTFVLFVWLAWAMFCQCFSWWWKYFQQTVGWQCDQVFVQVYGNPPRPKKEHKFLLSKVPPRGLICY